RSTNRRRPAVGRATSALGTDSGITLRLRQGTAGIAPTAAGRRRPPRYNRPATMSGLLEAIEIKRKMFFEFEDAPYHCLEVDISKPTARGGQTLVRIKMRNLITRAVFDRTFKAGDKFGEPDLVTVPASFLYADADGHHFMDQGSFETLTLRPE